MPDEAAVPPTAFRPRWFDWLLAAAAAAFYALVWALLPAEWLSVHVGGKGFLAVFIATTGLAALVTSTLVLGRRFKTPEAPAIWLAAQTVFWNPISFRAVLAAAEGVGASGLVPGVLALVGLLALGLPTSLIGAALCRKRWWVAVYLIRALQCLFATWVPLIPALFFLHALLIALVATWHDHGWRNRLAVSVVLAEQVAAFAWVLLYYQFETA